MDKDRFRTENESNITDQKRMSVNNAQTFELAGPSPEVTWLQNEFENESNAKQLMAYGKNSADMDFSLATNNLLNLYEEPDVVHMRRRYNIESLPNDDRINFPVNLIPEVWLLPTASSIGYASLNLKHAASHGVSNFTGIEGIGVTAVSLC